MNMKRMMLVWVMILITVFSVVLCRNRQQPCGFMDCRHT